MEIIYVSVGALILCSMSSITLAKPFDEEKSFSDDNKLRCTDSNEALDYERSNPNSFTDFYKPRSKFEGSSKPFEYDKKRSTYEMDDNFATGTLKKRQVGVVYKDDKPIGILQPYQRSYRFIPVKEEDLYGFSSNQAQDISYNLPSIMGVDKRDVNGMNLDAGQMDASYPSILTNFKIVNKLDKKRNYDALTDENVRDLKATIRRLRSSNSHNNEQIEEELKNILDEMGLIEDEEVHGEKREISEEQIDDENEPLLEDETKLDKERNKRDEPCIHNENSDPNNKVISEHNFLNSDEKRNEAKNDIFSHTPVNKRESIDDSSETHRKKRQKPEMAAGINKENSQLVENLKDSGDLMVSGNKSPLASSSEITARDTENKESEKRSYDEENDDYEKRVEHQIQSKINSLKEEVKREIEALKKRQSDDDDEDMQRRKRQAFDNLINEETDELNPAMNPDGELKPLVRKRRHVNRKDKSTNLQNVRKKREAVFSFGNRKKRRNDHSSDIHSNEKNYKARNDENDDGGELLGDDDFDNGAILKRQVNNRDQGYQNLNHKTTNLNKVLYERSKRSGTPSNNFGLYDDNKYLYTNYFYDNGRLKRQNVRGNQLFGNRNVRDGFIPRRSNQWRSRFRRRINENQVWANRPQQLSDMSDLDLFGALPKSYDGELSRYKRVKRK